MGGPLSALAGSVFTVRFEFSAPLAASPSDSLPFALQGGSQVAGSFESVRATVFTLNIERNRQSAGTLLLTVPPGAFADATGKASSTVATSLTQAYNTVLPDAEPRADMKSAVVGDATGPFTVNIDFNIDVGYSFTPADLPLAGATASALTGLSAAAYGVADPSHGHWRPRHRRVVAGLGHGRVVRRGQQPGLGFWLLVPHLTPAPPPSDAWVPPGVARKSAQSGIGAAGKAVA